VTSISPDITDNVQPRAGGIPTLVVLLEVMAPLITSSQAGIRQIGGRGSMLVLAVASAGFLPSVGTTTPEKCSEVTVMPCSYGECIFSLDAPTNALKMEGHCSGRQEDLILSNSSIESVPSSVFDDIAPW